MSIFSIKKWGTLLLGLCFAFSVNSNAANQPEKEEWFKDLGFGMFIHWNIGSQLGCVISHSLASASEEYLDYYFNELPRTFYPKKFDPTEWASLARLAGMKYVVFTAKHHSGFCFWDTKTTDFNIMHTPFKRDITKEIVKAFKEQGIAIGIYFSPDDFHYLYEHQMPIGRTQDKAHYPMTNPGLMEYDKKQLKEIFQQFDPEILFIDGPAEGLRDYAWELKPEVVITRGYMATPEQRIQKNVSHNAWESCYTMGNAWQYKPTNNSYKSGHTIINMLIEVRAKGGNLLLNVGPKPDGELVEQEVGLLREVALWNAINGESIHAIRPWKTTKEGSTWYTASKDGKAVYAIVPQWSYGTRKEFLLKNVKATPDTKISILGHNGKTMEYVNGKDCAPHFENTSMGLLLSVFNGQRIYTTPNWPNPVTIKMTNVEYKAPVKEKVKIDGLGLQDGVKI